jgi:4-amino-4-deoxy-L-arabinose transferase-like glycosyltransferase
MKKFLAPKYILIAILLFAALLRLCQIEGVPPSASMDEASIGYNAYSVVKTGGDEFGDFPLISQRGYDDWRRSTYLLLVTPFVALLDLRVAAIRLPAVILSLLTVWAIYHITLLLFEKRSKHAVSVALATSFLVAVSPWHAYISRLGHEVNAYLSFFIFGLFFLLQARKNTGKAPLAMAFFILSLISYYAGQVFLPVFGVGVAFIYRSALVQRLREDKKFRVMFGLFIVILIPVLWNLFSPAAMIRFAGTSTFTPQAHEELYAKRVEMRNKAAENNDFVGMIRYNRRLYPFEVLFQGYSSHFNPQWLFANTSAEPFKAPNMGLLYMWELPFILIGMFALLVSREVSSRTKQLVFLWLFLSPLPASIATQAPHAMRSYLLIPVLQFFAAFGIIFVLLRLKTFKTLGAVTLAVVIALGLSAFYKNYFIVFPKEQSRSFHYAFSRVVPYVVSVQDQYEKVVFSNEGDLYQSYMVFLYYTRYDPFLYQRQGGTLSGGFAESHAFGKYEFRPITWSADSTDKNVLYVGNISDFPNGTSFVKTFTAADGTEVIGAVAL